MRARARRFIEVHLTLDLLWRLVVPVCVLAFNGLRVIQPNDFWWHLRVGQIILEEGSIPRTDFFSFTRFGATWVNQAWLMQVGLYLQYRLGGLPLVVFLHACTIAAGYALLQRALTGRGTPVVPAVAAFTAVVVGVRNWSVRPQSISFLYMGLLVLLLERYGRGHRRGLWLAVPLFALWANSHGAFIFGLAYLGLYLAGSVVDASRARGWAAERAGLIRLALVAAACTAAPALTPEGPAGMVDYVLGFVRTGHTINGNVEFSPLSARGPDAIAFYLGLLAVAVGLSRREARLSARRWLPLLTLSAGALWAHRVLPWAGFALAPALVDLYARRSAGTAPERRNLLGINLLLAIVMAAGLVGSLPWLRPVLQPGGMTEWTAPDTPVAAVDFLCREAPAGARVYQEQGFASYQILACPALPVFIDTRIELYPLEHWLDYLAVSNARFDWEEILARHEVDYLLLDLEAQEHAVRAAEASANWQETYRDDRAVVFRRVGE